MDARKLSALYGLKWNPFLSDIPVEALHKSSRFDHFAWRIEDLVMHGASRSSPEIRAPASRW